MPVSAVLFDFDGVLVDTEWEIYQAWLATFRDHGQDLPLSLYTRCIGSDFDSWSPKLHLEELTRLKFDWLKLDERRQVRIRSALAEHGPIDGVEDVLKGLSRRNIPLAVVSSSSHGWVDGWLEKLNLSRYFQEIVCKGDAPRIKPEPDLFLEAARRLKLDPANCLVIEDSLNGLKAAKSAGMQTWIVPNRVTSCLDFTEADSVFQDFGRVLAAIDDLKVR
jgi:putative hydrolase of the HAD superfamily